MEINPWSSWTWGFPSPHWRSLGNLEETPEILRKMSSPTSCQFWIKKGGWNDFWDFLKKKLVLREVSPPAPGCPIKSQRLLLLAETWLILWPGASSCSCDSKFLQYQESWGQVDIRWVVLKGFWWEGVFKPWIRQTLYTRALHPQERVDNIHQPPLALSHYSTLVWALCLAGFCPLSPRPPYICSVCVYYKGLRKGSLKKC